MEMLLTSSATTLPRSGDGYSAPTGTVVVRKKPKARTKLRLWTEGVDDNSSSDDDLEDSRWSPQKTIQCHREELG
jgi:hypothetical protein